MVKHQNVKQKKFNKPENKNKSFRNKENFHKGKGKFKKTQKEALIEEDVVENKDTGFDFDFDNETNILSKLKGEKHKKTKVGGGWDYKNIIDTETKVKYVKEQNKPMADHQDVEMQPKEKDTEIKEEQEDETNNFNLDKFESEIYAKNASFKDFNLSRLILKACSDMEYFHPTKVQDKVIPLILRNHDVLINSETGSGKTACYLLPIIQKILNHKGSANEIKALIIIPTRELAYQCGEMVQTFTKYLDTFNSVILCGGMSVENQLNQLNAKPDIIIATPGRLIDIIYNYKTFSLEYINIIVLDEADKLLELGFKDAIMEIFNIVKNNDNRQTLLFSATLNPKIVDLGKDTLKRPVKLKLAASAILANLKQSIVRIKFKIEDNDDNVFEKRMAYLISLLIKGSRKRSMIFFNTKLECHKAKLILDKFNIRSAELHSDIEQTERLKSLDEFQKGSIHYLLATDIAGRGIDVEKVRCVINFQMPLLPDRYIHRVGRTARKGYIGEAVTICDEKDRLILKKLIKKEHFNLNVIKTDNVEIKKFYKELLTNKEEVRNDMENYEIEKELIGAEKEVDRAMNLKIHYNEIHNRPRK
jgi:ATP-dependent RNA helicase DDX27